MAVAVIHVGLGIEGNGVSILDAKPGVTAARTDSATPRRGSAVRSRGCWPPVFL